MPSLHKRSFSLPEGAVKLIQSRAPRIVANYFSSAGVPIIVGLLCVPRILHNLGPGAFGLLTLYWALLTFLTNFDFGVSQTLMKLIASHTKHELDDNDAKSMAASFAAQFLIGAAMGVGVIAATLFLDQEHRASLWGPYRWAFLLSVSTIPLLSLTIGLRATLEAKLDFHFVSVILLISGVTQFLIPLVFSEIDWGLGAIVAGTLATRAALFLAMAARIWSKSRFSPHAFRVTRGAIKQIWDVGFWIAVANVLTPFVAYVDRFLLPFYQPLSVVVLYSLPLEFLPRLMIFPTLINRIVFSYLIQGGGDPNERHHFVYRVAALGMSAYGVCLLAGAFVMPVILHFWLGAGYAAVMGRISQILLVGLSFSGLTFLSTSALIARGRSDIDPKIQMVILPFFLAGAVISMMRGDLVWLAIFWCLRVAVQSIGLLFVVRSLLPQTARRIAEGQIIFHVVSAALVFLSTA